MIKRIFYPIGQGAFYSEQFNHEFTIVYDCGNFYHEISAQHVVANSFPKNSVIDILFISHFDRDHVNLIDILKANCKIKKVVLPLLHKGERILLKNIYTSLGIGYNSIRTLITNPSEYFGPETAIISVDFELNENNENSETSREINGINDNVRIKSGTILKNNNWIFIPYNIDYKIRNIELQRLFIKYKLDIDLFKYDLSYAIKNKNIIKKIYANLPDGINANSMLLYSGPLDTINKKFEIEYIFSTDIKIKKGCCIYYTSYNCLPACVYTGDSDLNITKISKIFNKYWKNVGTIQIPHHGSEHNFDINLLNYKPYVCPMSYGLKNIFGHPSTKVINNIIKNNSLPILVNEKICFCEIIT
ncbi:hypothetical protein AGMMS49587_09230 [Spirochaetia bacterium]|nr:hypothetical protein AGMMS49587_09230 [Spirochaetia bacterium]